jgi:hypothetical protein
MKKIIESFISFGDTMHVTTLQFSIPLKVNASPRDAEAFRAAVPEIAAIFLQRHEFRQQERMSEYVDLLLKDVPMRAVDKRVADLQARALARVYQGCEWLTADEVGTLGGHGKANPAAAAHRWKDQGLVFALRRTQKDMYPRYVFSDDFKPLPAVKEILQAFGKTSATRIAAWFESTSSFLNGKRPRELIASDPARVVRAAMDAIQAEREPA